jgi:MYND finger
MAAGTTIIRMSYHDGINKVFNPYRVHFLLSKKKQMTDLCKSCNLEKAAFVCGSCKTIRYCGNDCQKWDWIHGGHGIDCSRLFAPLEKRARSRRNHGKLTPAKAREILHHGEVRGHKLTDRQRRFFGWVAGGRK